MSAQQTFMGTGLYGLPEAARYLRVPSATLRRWVTGYAFAADGDQNERRSSTPVLRRPVVVVEGEMVLTFADLVELQFVSLFRRHGVSLPVIRAAAARAAQLFQTDYPFNVRRLQTDGRRIFAELDPERVEGVPRERVVQELKEGQIVLGPFAEMFYKDLDYDHDVASCWWPLGKKNRAVLDPARNFGKPSDDVTRVPLYPLYRMVRAGEPVASVARWYGVDEEAVETALRFESGYLLKAA